MSSEAKASDSAVAPKKKRGKLILIAVPVALLLVVAGLWFSGILPHLLFGAPKAAAQAQEQGGRAAPPVYVELPEMVANLNAGNRRDSYLKLHAKLEVASAADQAAALAAMPKLLDLFQTYLREMRPEELRGSIGTWRLREELLNRANVALAPVRVTAVLFTEMLVQ